MVFFMVYYSVAMVDVESIKDHLEGTHDTLNALYKDHNECMELTQQYDVNFSVPIQFEDFRETLGEMVDTSKKAKPMEDYMKVGSMYYYLYKLILAVYLALLLSWHYLDV